MTTVPRWDLAPKLNRPLSLWKPQDYALIIYWVFFFPQALNWYLRTYCPPVEGWEKLPIWQRGRQFFTTPQGQFWLQSQLAHAFFNILTVPVLGFGLATLCQQLNYEVDWGEVIVRVIGSMVFGIGVGVIFSIGFGLFFDLIGGSSGGIAGSILGGMMGGVTGGVGLGVIEGLAVGSALGGAFGVAWGIKYITVALEENIIFGVSLGVIGSVILSLIGDLFAGVCWLITWSIFFLHPFNYLESLMFYRIGYLTWLPLPWLSNSLVKQLRNDFSGGLHNILQLLFFTQQSFAVQKAITKWIADAPSEDIVQKLCHMITVLGNPTEPRITLFIGNEIPNAELAQNKFWLTRLKNWNISPPQLSIKHLWENLLDFADGQVNELIQLLENNQELQNLSQIKELKQLAKAIRDAQNIESIQEISYWYGANEWLNKKEDFFRPGSKITLQILYAVAGKVHIAHHSLSKFRRVRALSEALAQLNMPIVLMCPKLESRFISNIVAKWEKKLKEAAGQAGQLEITQPVENPFVVGAPVSGALFVGREDIFTELEELWGDDPGRRVDSLVLYGHRRMGKTSILQNIGPQFGAKTVVAFVNLQRLGRLQHPGELWAELALTMYEALQQVGLATTLPEPALEPFLAHPTFEMNRFVAKVRPVLSGRRLILALDEFELLEAKIRDKQISPEVIDYLRGLIHSEPWLVLVLAGLHTLEEMTQNYWHPLFASVRAIRVGFLTEGAIGQLLANPHEDFPLDISREAAGFIHQWTAGQPFLVQLTGSRLVRLYNQILFEQGVKRSEQFTVEDVQAVMFDPEFFSQGSGYFLGVWGQTEPGAQQQLLIYLAGCTSLEQPAVAEADLLAGVGLDPAGGQSALAALQQRDIIALEKGQVRFTVPLLRYWVKEVLSRKHP